jgi:hypothetical protein
MQLKKEESDLGGCLNAALDLHTDALGKIQEQAHWVIYCPLDFKLRSGYKELLFLQSFTLLLLSFFTTFFSFHRHCHGTTNESHSIQQPETTNAG